MIQADIHEAKSNLSKLADLAHEGETIVIAKSGKPYVDLVPHNPKQTRWPGGYDLEIEVFDVADSDIESMFFDSGVE